MIGNMETLTESVKWMYFGITLELALNMGWIMYRTADENKPDHVVQGPNLRLVFKDKKGPKADFTEEQFQIHLQRNDLSCGSWSHKDGKRQTTVSGSWFYPTCTI